MAEPHIELSHEARGALAAIAHPAKAAPMQAYMRSEMPFLGVQKPDRVKALRSVFSAYELPDRDTWVATVRDLWDEADYREERYAAIELARDRRYTQWATDARSMALYDHLIVTGAWWDYVDEVAIQLVGPVLRARPDIGGTIRRWAHDDNRWRRRAAVISQVGAREATDFELLAACILANAADTDFFLRKGIGWALREYAKTDPDWVRAFVAMHHDRLSPLSVREATRNLPVV